ncbi:MAG: hypothetical protein V8T36_01790 [Ruthenibacterium lactatiformans]
MNKEDIVAAGASLCAGVRPFLHRWDTSGAQKAQPPAVYVVHHRNMSGPVHTLALLPDEPRPWVLHVFLDRHECFAQYYGYTFRKRLQALWRGLGGGGASADRARGGRALSEPSRSTAA